jgi:AraC family transcriptional regulator of adaptative response / DNA-3-methyladenine glycosylase II
MVRTRLVTRTPFDGPGVLRYLAGHAVPGVENADAGGYERLVVPNDAGSEAVRIRVEPDGRDGVVLITERPPGAGLVARIRRLFDLDADSAAIDAHLAGDPALTELVRDRPGIRIPGSLDLHEQLFRTLLGQQISIAAARTVVARLVRELCGASGLFPTAAQLAELGPDVLRGPASRRAAIHGVAVAIASRDLVVDATLSVDELTARLVAMPGIGPWTAGYVALRTLGAPDVLLATDLVLLKGAALLRLPAEPRTLAEYAKRWSPYRSYAGLHLWRAALERA